MIRPTDFDEPSASQLGDEFDLQPPPESNLPAVASPQAGSWAVPTGPAADRAQAAIITAQKVAEKRNVRVIREEAIATGRLLGKDAYYSLPFRSKDKDGKWVIKHAEGPTIGCTMAAMGIYGNCIVNCRPFQETPTHWYFDAVFCDLEKGVTVNRPFLQRKGADTGMKDTSRKEDMLFQSAVSKAERNVVKAGLKWVCDLMVYEAKRGVRVAITEKPEKARAWLKEKIADMQIDLALVERHMQRTVKDWSVDDMTVLFGNINALVDGLVTKEELWPPIAKESEPAESGPERPQEPGPAETKPRAARRRAADTPPPPAPPPAPAPPSEPGQSEEPPPADFGDLDFE